MSSKRRRLGRDSAPASTGTDVGLARQASGSDPHLGTSKENPSGGLSIHRDDRVGDIQSHFAHAAVVDQRGARRRSRRRAGAPQPLRAARPARGLEAETASGLRARGSRPGGEGGTRRCDPRVAARARPVPRLRGPVRQQPRAARTPSRLPAQAPAPHPRRFAGQSPARGRSRGRAPGTQPARHAAGEPGRAHRPRVPSARARAADRPAQRDRDADAARADRDRRHDSTGRATTASRRCWAAPPRRPRTSPAAPGASSPRRCRTPPDGTAVSVAEALRHYPCCSPISEQQRHPAASALLVSCVAITSPVHRQPSARRRRQTSCRPLRDIACLLLGG